MFDDQAQVPDTASLVDEVGAAGRAPRNQRVVRAHVDRWRYSMLDELASESGVRPEQLAGIWLRERIDQEAGSRALARLADELSEMRAFLARPGPADRSSAGARTDGGGRDRRRTRGRRHAESARESLHGEIVTVLAQHGQPMTAAEIARAIRERGHYRPPRSGNPISGAAVSRRIANPYYRSLFERRGRQVRLAADADG